MTKILATLMIGATLVGAAPALAGNSADVIQQGGGLNTIDAEQRGRNNDAEAFQDGLFNEVDVKQRRRR